MVIIKSHLVEFANFGMVKFITICIIVKIIRGKMVEIDNDSQLFSLIAICIFTNCTSHICIIL